jgi:plastocyanin
MNLTKPILWLIALILLLVALIIFSGAQVGRNLMPVWTQEDDLQPVDKAGVRIPPPRPEPTEADLVANQNPKGFQLLVSYVNSGFEPHEASIKVGDTVRFTNNSTHDLWVAASGAGGSPLYPGVDNGCGSSQLDTCKALKPGEYWEFTFAAPGSWSFSNNLDKAKTGDLVVTVR